MKLFDAVFDLLYPRRCTFCHRLLSGKMSVCPLCRDNLPYTGKAAGQSFSNGKLCVSPLYYEKHVRDSLLRFKFGGLRMYASVYGEYLEKCIDENGISCDSITWVPLSRRRLRRRGYDQARLLAEELAARMGLPCVPTLRKVRHNRAQSSTGNAKKRRQNVKGVYALLPDAEIKGKTLLLVDDIVTTGATLSECASVLKHGGAAEVFAVTVARRKE